MPTENRSSNTEMAAQLSPCPHCGQQDAFVEQLDSDASVVICQGRIDEHSACLARGPVGVQQHECEDQPGHNQAVKEWNKRGAAMHHPDPIAWMVGTAFWWTKEEAERDAAETGLPIVGLGPMAGAVLAGQHQGEPVTLPARKDPTQGWAVPGGVAKADGWNACLDEIAKLGPLYTHADTAEVESLKADKQAFAQNAIDLRAEVERLRAACEAEFRSVEVLTEANQKLQAQLAEAQALLQRSATDIRDYANDYPADHSERARLHAMADVMQALSASAEPSAPTWSCQSCQLEQPTDRPCDVCGGKTEPVATKP